MLVVVVVVDAVAAAADKAAVAVVHRNMPRDRPHTTTAAKE
jgi:hypothetical protein